MGIPCRLLNQIKQKIRNWKMQMSLKIQWRVHQKIFM